MRWRVITLTDCGVLAQRQPQARGRGWGRSGCSCPYPSVAPLRSASAVTRILECSTLLATGAHWRLFLQGIAAAGALHQLQPATGQQAPQRGLRCKAAGHGRAAEPLGQRRVKRQRQARGRRHFGHGAAQRAGRNLVALERRESGSGGRISGMGSAGGQGAAQHGQAYGLGNRVKQGVKPGVRA